MHTFMDVVLCVSAISFYVEPALVIYKELNG